MGIREKLNQHRNVTIGAACAVIGIAIVLVVLQALGGAAAEDGVITSRQFFTTDDGKTWFTDDARNVPPYTKHGKEAVRAYVYRTGDGTEFVGYLQRYSPAGKKMIEDALARPIEEQLDSPFIAAEGTMQWKKPGDATWIGARDPRADQVTKVVSPKGPGDTVSPVPPPQ